MSDTTVKTGDEAAGRGCFTQREGKAYREKMKETIAGWG